MFKKKSFDIVYELRDGLVHIQHYDNEPMRDIEFQKLKDSRYSQGTLIIGDTILSIGHIIRITKKDN